MVLRDTTLLHGAWPGLAWSDLTPLGLLGCGAGQWEGDTVPTLGPGAKEAAL